MSRGAAQRLRRGSRWRLWDLGEKGGRERSGVQGAHKGFILYDEETGTNGVDGDSPSAGGRLPDGSQASGFRTQAQELSREPLRPLPGQ